MKTKRHFADPTAWEAIAKADRKPNANGSKRSEDADWQQAENNIGVWRSQVAEAALNAGGKPFRIWRKENINPLLRLINDQRRRVLQLEEVEKTAEGDTAEGQLRMPDGEGAREK